MTEEEIENFNHIMKMKTDYDFKRLKLRKKMKFYMPQIGDKVMYCSSSKNGSSCSGYGIVVKMKTIDSDELHAMYMVLDLETKEEKEVMMNSRPYPNDVIAVVIDDTRYAVYDSLHNTVLTESINMYKADVEDFMTHKYGTDWRSTKTMYSIKKIKISVQD